MPKARSKASIANALELVDEEDLEGYKPVDEDGKYVDLIGVDEDDDDQTGHKMSGRARNITTSFSIILKIGCGSFVGFSVLIIVYALCKLTTI